MKRIILAFTMLVCILLTGCECKHDWLEISRTEPGCAENGIVRFACSKCDETNKETIPATETHTWVEATCDIAKHCSQCGLQEGTSIGHTWVDATCTEPKYCSTCNATDGEPPSHSVTTGLCDKCGYQVTPYGLYSPKDYKAFEAIQSVIERFKNPASVKIVKIHHCIELDEGDNVYYVTLSAQNGFGGTNSSYYRISSSSIMESSAYRDSVDSSYDISSINELLKEYCKSQGWE